VDYKICVRALFCKNEKVAFTSETAEIFAKYVLLPSSNLPRVEKDVGENI
jgi:hypothetical protein